MRGSEAIAAAPDLPASPRWLLIGNSRWHWAGTLPTPPCPEASPGEDAKPGLWMRHAPPWSHRAGAIPPPEVAQCLLGWAAVGPIPAGLDLPAERRLSLAEIPLVAMPPWLGIDRALCGWQAWRQLGGPVLVADAGTVLSLTRVDAGGRFAGGRLQAGLALQLRAMAHGTEALPQLSAPANDDRPAAAGAWPQETAAAMTAGVSRGLAAAILAAIAELRQEDPCCRLVLTGGDGEALLPMLAAAEASLLHRPALALEAIADLRPEPPRRRGSETSAERGPV